MEELIKRQIQVLSFFVIFLMIGSGISAKGECREDRQKLCKDVKLSEGRIYECLVKNINELSPACKTKIENHKKEWDAFQSACGEDLKKNCPNITPGQGKIHGCLKKNKKNLSESCKNFIKEKKDKKHKEGLDKVIEMDKEIQKVD